MWFFIPSSLLRFTHEIYDRKGTASVYLKRENSPKIISTCMNEHLYELWATNLKIWVSWRQKYAFITKLYFWLAFVTIGVSKSFFKLCMRLLLLFATQVVQRKHLTKCISFTHQLYTTYLLVWHNYISL